jgi:hypothetical protein
MHTQFAHAQHHHHHARPLAHGRAATCSARPSSWRPHPIATTNAMPSTCFSRVALCCCVRMTALSSPRAQEHTSETATSSSLHQPTLIRLSPSCSFCAESESALALRSRAGHLLPRRDFSYADGTHDTIYAPRSLSQPPGLQPVSIHPWRAWWLCGSAWPAPQVGSIPTPSPAGISPGRFLAMLQPSFLRASICQIHNSASRSGQPAHLSSWITLSAAVLELCRSSSLQPPALKWGPSAAHPSQREPATTGGVDRRHLQQLQQPILPPSSPPGPCFIITQTGRVDILWLCLFHVPVQRRPLKGTWRVAAPSPPRWSLAAHVECSALRLSTRGQHQLHHAHLG